MFTGIVEDVGTVREAVRDAGLMRLVVGTRLDLRDTSPGASIAVDGACYTVVTLADGAFTVELSEESLRRTIAGAYRRGTRVNLERCLKVGAGLGGHIVLGHVDAVGVLTARRDEGASRVHTYRAPRATVGRYLVEKGSVTLDGVSLTVGPPHDDPGSGDATLFDVFLIPHTLAVTTLGDADRGPGARVNLEADILGKYVARLVTPYTTVKT